MTKAVFFSIGQSRTIGFEIIWPLPFTKANIENAEVMACNQGFHKILSFKHVFCNVLSLP
jgi:hypothetical protein